MPGKIIVIPARGREKKKDLHYLCRQSLILGRMKIALLGYGKMGREVEKAALARNHEICLVIDISNTRELNEKNLANADMAIDFSTPDSAYENIITCFQVRYTDCMWHNRMACAI